jgi:hypothetical protein
LGDDCACVAADANDTARTTAVQSEMRRERMSRRYQFESM